MRRILFAAVLLFASTVMSFASLSASGSITWVKSGANYVYTLTLKNTGTTNVGFMFFGWIPGENYLPSTPSSAGTPSGWSLVGINPAGGGSGASIEWQANTPIAPGGSLTGFTFTTVDAPSKIFANTNLFADHNPITTTVVYSGGLFPITASNLTSATQLRTLALPFPPRQPWVAARW